MTKDWVGNQRSVFGTMGASNHTEKERQANDYYATDPKAIDILLENEKFEGSIWECACGGGHLSERLIKNGYDVISTDLVDRGYGETGVDFLLCDKALGDNIITNPPYKYVQDFCEKAYNLVAKGFKVAMFMKLLHLEGKARKKMWLEMPLKTLYVSSSRILCAKSGDFEEMIKGGGSATAYAWYVWEKGYKGETVIKWIN